MPRIAALAALALTFPLLAQQPQTSPRYGENVEVSAVLLDTIVTDSTGSQILGIDKNDFVIKENGVEQPAESIDYYTNRRLLDTPEGNAPFKVEHVLQDRYFIFFFDKPNNNELWDQLVMARKGVIDFLNERMLPTDHIAIVGQDVRLKVYSDFTNDKPTLLSALNDATSFSKGILAPQAGAETSNSILANVDKHKMMSRSGTVYEALQVLAEAIKPIRGRKDLVLFSAGIREPGEESRNGILLNTSRYYDPMIHDLNAANVTVYPVNILRNPPELPVIHQTLDRIAADTNGYYFRQNVSFLTPIKKVESLNSGYYLITYTAHHPQGSHGYQKVEVSIRNHPEFHVQSRPGYVYGDESK